ncbi:uncharacterized protein LOC106172813 [Lingula anatina]|uniref:Uncharacterized protein LOC106172813 n=1 Tax=Lingula anatina TaxID=7574 RepID=A0A1S3JFN7_LINAN|nr:uncharacterized protein LOC106172813 [Lingula anatina]|eukprot:XP_013409173.1 uncharacterized protein LOC106172813 [Lingula anatina]
MSHESKRNIVDEYASYSEERIIQSVAKGKDFKLNGDNLDIYVSTNDIRIDNKNRDYHYFASDVTFDRVDTSCLDDSKPLGDIDSVTYKNFVSSVDEDTVYKDSLKVILARVLCDNVPGFGWMKAVIPKHIAHNLEDVMCQKSEIHWLPIMLKNEACYSDCIQIMDEYEKMITSWFNKAHRGSELSKVQVPVGGDQLTRVRLEGAKNLKAGALTKTDRLEHLNPIIIEMFHTRQDLLEKLYKNLFKSESGRDKGTLCHLKILIERNNVNGKVKGRFEAHEDFIFTSGCAYFLSFIMDLFQMETLEDDPKHQLLKYNIKMMHLKDKEKIFSEIMTIITDKLVVSFPKEEQDSKILLLLTVLGHQLKVYANKDGKLLVFDIIINSIKYSIKIDEQKARLGCSVPLPNGVSIFVVTSDEHDDLYNYASQLLQWYFLILSMKDAIKEGDTIRNNIHLKFSIPIFFKHSPLSKYMEECIDYIFKTEVILSEKMALRVKAGSFVNLSGRKGENKAADLHKENEVLVLKELIRGLGANKTEKSIVRVSKSALVIRDVTANFDKMLCIPEKKTRHKKRSFENDVKAILKVIVPLKIWKKERGRALAHYRNIDCSPFTIDRTKFQTTVNGIIGRLKRGIVIPQCESDEETDDSS